MLRLSVAASYRVSLKNVLSALRRCERGSPAIEFAFVVPAFMALILGVLHLSLLYLAQEGLETAAENSARLIMTGQAQKYAGTNASGVAYTGMTQADFKTAACAQLPKFLTCDRLLVDVTTVSSFSNVSAGLPTLAYNGSGQITNSFSYTPGTSNGTSAQSQIVVLKLIYLWPMATGPLGFNLAEERGNHKISASSVLLTENY
jgi:Flp pilus assembly protein TadG